MDDSKKKKTLILNTLILLFCVVIIALFCFIPNNKVQELETYKVNFESEGGSSIAALEIEEGKSAEKPEDPTREGYIFVGWMLGDELYDFSQKIEGDITLRAEWKQKDPDKNYYSVAFDTTGGSIIDSQEVEEGSLPTRPIDPTRDNFEFAGWVFNGQEYNFDIPVTYDITIVARWNEVQEEPEDPSENIYTVTFNSNGGTRVASQKVKHGEKATKPADPTRSGYTFDGWRLGSANGSTFNFNSTITRNITLVAKWNAIPKKTYTVRFVDESGRQVGSTITVEDGSKVPSGSIPNAPAKANYDFKYWVNNNRNINSVTITGDITFTPHYEPKTFTISCTSTSLNVNQSCTVDFQPVLDTNGTSLNCIISGSNSLYSVPKVGNQFTTNSQVFKSFASCTINIGGDTFPTIVSKN